MKGGKFETESTSTNIQTQNSLERLIGQPSIGLISHKITRNNWALIQPVKKAFRLSILSRLTTVDSDRKMASIGFGGSPLRQKGSKIHNAKKFLSLQVSQTSHALSSELNHMLRAQTLARKRKKVINEIFTTEKTYQHHLHTITTVFVNPLRQACIVPLNVLNTIFSNIEGIEAINKELLSHMETLGVGDAFLAMAPFIKLYSTYANNFEAASRLLQEWEKKSPEFSAFITRQEALEECQGLNIRALLITPVQRVPRYKLLLESLLNKTPRDYPDFSKLEEATYEIAKVAEHINENIRQHENFQKMLSIQKCLTGEGAPKILAPGRFFIKEGPLLKACRRGSQERMFFLFSDILIYAKKSSSLDKEQCTYSCRRVFPLFECTLEQMFGSSVDTDGAADVGSLFKVTCRDKTLLLYSKSKQEAATWFSAIRDAISNLKSNRASLRRVSRGGESETEKQNTPLRRSAAVKSKIMCTPKELRQRAASLDCASPAVCLKDSLYPLRKELKATKSNNPTNSILGCRTPRTNSKDSLISGPGTSNESDTRDSATDDVTLEVGVDDGSYVDEKGALSDSPWIESESDDDDAHTPSGLLNSDSEAMIDTSATPSGAIDISQQSSVSSSENGPGSSDECNGVMTRGRKRKIFINEKENQVYSLHKPRQHKRMCFIPKFSCVSAKRSPLTEKGRL
ncbi:FYVE, RhoGEF and PH domain-containing protein 2 [Nematostella vectensis]|uniref:FYVE, RhoGEF and PH domain-containing protein 2 n=1 Tax=Nematostella vectensis TaxID=45351 RepID=UPI00207703FE|nr:FYVE, RhoGEF and PH domain-containing protein 2 [Nematostella vectensis]